MLIACGSEQYETANYDTVATKSYRLFTLSSICGFYVLRSISKNSNCSEIALELGAFVADP